MRVAILTTDNREHFRNYDRPAPYFGTAPSALLQGLSMIPETEVHVVSCTRRPIAAPEKLAANIFFHSLVVPPIGWMKTFFQGCVRATRKKIAELRPDIVHGQGTESDCSMNAVFSGRRNVLTLHGNMRRIAKLNGAPAFSYNWLAARLEGFVLPRCEGVVCISEHTRRAVQGLAPRTWLVPNAVDESFFAVHGDPGASDIPTGLCVGTICPLKNQNALIRALDPLAGNLRFRIVFAGEVAPGGYGEEFRGLLRDRPWCQHVGFLSRDQLKTNLASAAFVVLPTLEDNCPMVVLEGMAVGLPVMASSVGGIPDLIESGKSGILCDPSQPESFREAAGKLLTDRAWARQLAVAAKAEAARRFHPRIIAAKHLEIYQQVLSS
jgi:glycosyltransferase involved in cell wall biosynthesis